MFLGRWCSMLSRCFAVLAATVVVASAAAGAPGVERARAALLAGLASVDSLLAAGDAEAAAREAAALRKSRGMSDDLLWQVEQRLGVALHALGRSQAALDHLERATAWAPRVAENHRSLAAVLMALGRQGRALGELREAVALAPQDVAMRLEYSQALMDYRQYPRAAREIEIAAGLCGDCSASDRARARLAMLQGDYEAAVPPLRRLQLSGDDPEITRNLALSLVRSGDPAGARTLLIAAGSATTAWEVRLLLEADRALGDAGRARELVAVARGGGGGDYPAELWALAALICHEQGLPEDGLLLVDRAIALDPGNAAYRNNRVVLLTSLGRSEEADREMEALLAIDPSRDVGEGAETP